MEGMGLKKKVPNMEQKPDIPCVRSFICGNNQTRYLLTVVTRSNWNAGHGRAQEETKHASAPSLAGGQHC